MIENLKIIAIGLVFIGLCFVLWLAVSDHDREQKAKQLAEKEYVKKCTASGGSIAQIGNGFTTDAYLVCNPK